MVAVCWSRATLSSLLRLQLCEEADVLDRDDGLVGEGFEEPDLLLGEGTDFHAPNQDRAKGNSLAQQWGGQRRAVADLPLVGLAIRILGVRLRREVVYVNRPPIDDGAPSHRPAADLTSCVGTRNRPMSRHSNQG